MVYKGISWRNVRAKISVARLFCTSVKNGFFIECLKNRELLRVTGTEIEGYIQGLITNDVKHLSDGPSCMYTMFLNSKGRVLYDTIIYKSYENKTLFIECDASASDHLKKHMLTYKVRRKISIESLKGRFSVWVACKKNSFEACYSRGDVMATVNQLKESFGNCLVCGDPRIANLGVRIVAPSELSLMDIMSKIQDSDAAPMNFYKKLRYKLGIGEGILELPPGQCLPLEANCDYLHGVSFHKGCYIGQELTARTYHTGVIRKRLMPIIFDEEILLDEMDVPILLADNSEKQIGKLKGVEGTVGIALLRIEEALKSGQFKIHGKISRTSRPFWWPTEFQKENIKLR